MAYVLIPRDPGPHVNRHPVNPRDPDQCKDHRLNGQTGNAQRSWNRLISHRQPLAKQGKWKDTCGDEPIYVVAVPSDEHARVLVALTVVS